VGLLESCNNYNLIFDTRCFSSTAVDTFWCLPTLNTICGDLHLQEPLVAELNSTWYELASMNNEKVSLYLVNWNGLLDSPKLP